jgi:hypothetical protein
MWCVSFHTKFKHKIVDQEALKYNLVPISLARYRLSEGGGFSLIKSFSSGGSII